MSKSDDAVHSLHVIIEKFVTDALPMELVLIVKAGILCPTCSIRDMCVQYPLVMAAWETARKIIDDDTSATDISGIGVPLGMFDLNKES